MEKSPVDLIIMSQISSPCYSKLGNNFIVVEIMEGFNLRPAYLEQMRLSINIK